MSANPIIFFIFYFLIVVAVLGFGIVFRKIIFKSSSLFNLGFDGLVGIFILTIYSYVSHFFFSHNLEHNFLVILTGLIMFFLNYNKIKYNFELKIFISVFLILFFAFIAFKTHDDFSYYHFGYTNYLKLAFQYLLVKLNLSYLNYFFYRFSYNKLIC